jgi:hypothetical protein
LNNGDPALMALGIEIVKHHHVEAWHFKIVLLIEHKTFLLGKAAGHRTYQNGRQNHLRNGPVHFSLSPAVINTFISSSSQDPSRLNSSRVAAFQQMLFIRGLLQSVGANVAGGRLIVPDTKFTFSS